ncbi:CPBP family intramembrane glutamic endopeptidase [Corynebacterium sp. 335C]
MTGRDGTSRAANPARDGVARTPARLLRIEIAVVLLVTFGTSALQAVLRLAEALAAGSLSDQPLALNSSWSDNPWLDPLFQVVRIAALLSWGALAWLLLARDGVRGMPGRPRWSDLGWGAALAAGIGIPGLGLYVAGVLLGFGRPIDPAAMGVTLATAVPLLGWAAANAVAEELVVVGWLALRLRALGWSAAGIVAASAVLRGAYHLYQGAGAGAGNVVMGVVFAAWFLRTGRVWPLVAAHFLIDAVAFLGYPLAEPLLSQLA